MPTLRSHRVEIITARVRWRVLCALLLAVGHVTAPLPLRAQDEAANVTQLIQESQTSLATNDFEKAIRLAQRAVKLDPAYPPAWRQHGLALLRGGKPQDALTVLQRAVDMDEKDTTAWRGLAMAHWQVNQKNEAVRALSAYLRQKPEDAAIWRDLASWLSQMDRTEQAFAALERVIELKPDDASAWREIAQQHQRKGRLPDAVKAFEKSLTLRPVDPVTQRDLGWVLWRMGRREDAVKHLTEAIESGVDARDHVLFQVVARLSEEGAESEALAFLKRVNTNALPSGLGLELARAGRLRAAEPILASAWKTGEKTPEVGLYLAYSRALNGQITEFAGYLDPLLNTSAMLTPERADLALEVLRLCGTRPETPALAVRLENALDRKDRYGERVTEILETAAETGRIQGATEQALQLYRRVLERDPNRASWIWAVLLAERVEGKTPDAWLDDYEKRVTNPVVQLGVKGLRADRQGDAEAAIPALRKSLALNPQQPLLRQMLFDLLLQRGMVTDARVEADWFVKQVEKGDATLRSTLAEMLTRLGDTEKALAQWQLLHTTYPEQPYYGLETASALYQLDRPDEAMAVLETMTKTARDSRVFELLSEIASARGHTIEAVEWAARGLAVSPSQALLRYHAENLEKIETNAPAALASAQAFLVKDPGYVPLTLLAARMLKTMGETNKLIQFHRRLLERNPDFIPSLIALRDLTTGEGKINEAVEYAKARATVQPDNAEALRLYANSLAQQDQFRKALGILRPLAHPSLETAVPVLVYQSITCPPYDGRNSVDQINRHIQRLSKDGFVFVNSFDQLDKNSHTQQVMIILIDPDSAVIEALDPILKQYTARVVYVGNIVNPALTLAGQPIPDRVISLLATKRWQIASGGPANLRRQPVNTSGVLGSPLTHPVIINGTLEGSNVFAGRLDRVLAASAGTLAQKKERILVYPNGDFGQRSLDTTPDHLATLHKSVAQHFTHAVYLDDSGFYRLEPKTDPLRIPARAVPPEWDAEVLSDYLSSGHPLTRARLELARILYWHGQHEAANAVFARAAEDGADPEELLFNRGLNADRQGDVPTALKDLRAAQGLNPESDLIQDALERADLPRRPQAQVFLQGWKDNEDRRHYLIGADGDAFISERLSLGALVDRDWWETKGEDPEDGTRLGLKTEAYLVPQVWFAGRLWHLEMDDLENHWGGDAALRLPNPVLSGYFTLTAGREEIDTAEALREDIDSNLYAVRSYTRLFDVFDLFADLSQNQRTDDNDTTMLEGRLLYRVREWPYMGVGWRFRFADSDFDPPEYWAPQELEQHQLHLDLRGTSGRLKGTLSGDAGYAREQNTDWGFVWGTLGEGELSLTDRLSLSAQLGWSEGVVYERLYGRVGLIGRF